MFKFFIFCLCVGFLFAMVATCQATFAVKKTNALEERMIQEIK